MARVMLATEDGKPITQINPLPIRVINGEPVSVKNTHLDEEIFYNHTVANGAEVGVMISTAGFSRVFVMASGEAAYDVNSTPSPDGSLLLAKAKESLFSALANESDMKEVTKLAPSLYVTIKNTSASPALYNLWAYGV